MFFDVVMIFADCCNAQRISVLDYSPPPRPLPFEKKNRTNLQFTSLYLNNFVRLICLSSRTEFFLFRYHSGPGIFSQHEFKVYKDI